MILFLCAACTEEEQLTTLEAIYEGNLSDAELEDSTELIDEDSVLQIIFALDDLENPEEGWVLLDGELELRGYTIEGNGNEEREIADLEISDEELTGKVKIPIPFVPAVEFEGTFRSERNVLSIDVEEIGRMRLNLRDPDTGDTGI